MMLNAAAVCTSSLILSLLLHSCLTQKLNIHWGPQSMMYLKGKHGRRLVSEDRDLPSPPAWYLLLRGIQRLKRLNKPSSIDNIQIRFLQER
ncbi:uncharacterized protein ACB058_008392 isoform 2-T2 [Synchiropus picturatus]